MLVRAAEPADAQTLVGYVLDEAREAEGLALARATGRLDGVTAYVDRPLEAAHSLR